MYGKKHSEKKGSKMKTYKKTGCAFFYGKKLRHDHGMFLGPQQKDRLRVTREVDCFLVTEKQKSFRFVFKTGVSSESSTKINR